MASPELTEPSPGLFVLHSTYGERAIPKRAGFTWCGGNRCRRKNCAACAAGLATVWWTTDVLKALELAEHARPGLRARIEERAGPAAEARAAERERSARAAKVAKLERARTLLASRAKDADLEIPCAEALAYLPYQRAAIAFAATRPNVLFADEMGLGKTVEALGAVNADPAARRVLIVCPASLKLNWARECARWLVDRGPVGIAGKTFPHEAEIVIVNYDVLGKWRRELRRNFDVLIADECHYVKNKDAKRSKALFGIRARRKLFLTGTPILNRPVELVDDRQRPRAGGVRRLLGLRQALLPARAQPLRLGVQGRGEPRGAARAPAQLDHGAAHEGRGAVRPPAEAAPGDRVRLRAPRRADRRRDRGVGGARRRRGELRRLSRAGGGGRAAEAELEALRRGVRASFGELSKLRRETALAKLPLVVEHVRAVLEDPGKLVVFAHHREVIGRIAEAFEGLAVTLTGEHDAAERQAAVDRFQGDPGCRLFVGSITAAGLGLTLTASAHVVFAELDWVPARMTQAEDRTHRIGQEESVLVQHLVLEDSLDARMVRTLIRKQRVVDQVVDGDFQDDLFGDELAELLIELAEPDAAPG